MKTMRITGTLAGVGLALAMVASATAGGIGSAKGGAVELMTKPAPVQPKKEVVMACPKCKTEYGVKTDWSARGATKPSVITAKHLCEKCTTELKTVGVGKAARDVAVHTCKACKG